MGYQPEDIDDLTNTVLPTILKKGKWVDLSLPVQHLTVAEKFLGKLTEDPVSSGSKQVWDVQYTNTGEAYVTELFGQDRTSRGNIIKQGFQNWTLLSGNYIYDTREEKFQGPDVNMICDHIAALAHSARTKGLVLFENQLWSAPTSSTQRPRPLSGIPHWLQRSTMTGFNGGDPSGFSAGAGNILVADVPNSRNYTDTYSEVSNDNLFAKMRRACKRCNFKAPDPYPAAVPMEPNWIFYTDGDTSDEIDTELHNWNDNITDAGKFYGMGKFRGIKFDWVPVFDDATSSARDTTRPVYGINWATWLFQFQFGSALTFGRAHQAQGYEHNVRQVDWDSACNLACIDRRGNFNFYRV